MKSWRTKLNGAEFKILKLQETPTPEQLKKADNPEGVIEYLRAMLPGSLIYRPEVENMMVVYLNTRRNPIGFEIISNGTLDTLLVHPREVFRGAIVIQAAAIVLAHNHPSGDPSPSEADIKVTRDLIRAGQLMQIEVLDHVILGQATSGRGWVSLRELGYFYS